MTMIFRMNFIMVMMVMRVNHDGSGMMSCDDDGDGDGDSNGGGNGGACGDQLLSRSFIRSIARSQN